MDDESEATKTVVSAYARHLARAAQLWAIGGAIVFLPGAALMGFMGLLFLGPLGFLVLLPIGVTFFGAVLFSQGATALRCGEPGARRTLVWAALATWNILVLQSVSDLWPALEKAVSDWGTFVAEFQSSSGIGIYRLIAAFLHVVVNGALLVAACFVPDRNGDDVEPQLHLEPEPSTPNPTPRR